MLQALLFFLLFVLAFHGFYSTRCKRICSRRRMMFGVYMRANTGVDALLSTGKRDEPWSTALHAHRKTTMQT
jgi:hypothetical protein